MDFKEIVGWIISISGTFIILMAMVMTWFSLTRRMDDLERDLKKDARERRNDGPW